MTTPRWAQFWSRVLPATAPHLTRTVPWLTLLAGCATGTALLAGLAHLAGTSHTPLNQNSVRLTLLPAVAALAFVPRLPFRPLTQTTPAPAWLITTGQTLLAVPILAATCWTQLRLLDHTILPGQHPPAAYPLAAQFVGWCALAVAAAACCERSRFADLSGAIAAIISLATIAVAAYISAIRQHLSSPPATPDAATLAWYTIGSAALALAGAATRDQWHRYTRRLHRHESPID